MIVWANTAFCDRRSAYKILIGAPPLFLNSFFCFTVLVLHCCCSPYVCHCKNNVISLFPSSPVELYCSFWSRLCKASSPGSEQRKNTAENGGLWPNSSCGERQGWSHRQILINTHSVPGQWDIFCVYACHFLLPKTCYHHEASVEDC